MAKKLVVGNWKMNPSTLEEASRLIKGIERKIPKGVTAVACPPSVYLSSLTKRGKKSSLAFGVQNLFYESAGAFTGEISAKMAWSAGADYSIVGHSERRAAGESNDVVSKKIVASVKTGLMTILCIGEKERDVHGHYLSYLKAQILESIEGLSAAGVAKLIIAYEPVWAIGAQSKGAMEVRDLHETTLFIKKVLHEKFGKKALAIPLLYGGSVDPANASALITDGKVDGFLVGRDSLKPESFLKILNAAAGSR
jgi:triosephosphate isomerase